MKRSTPLRRTGRLRRLTPLRSRPSKRVRPDEPLAEVCEARIPVCCTGRAQHRHHLLLRAQGGTDDAWNTVDVCNACHRHIHAHPGWAYGVGLLLHRCPGSGRMVANTPEAMAPCPHCKDDVPLRPEGSGWGSAGLAAHGLPVEREGVA